MPRFIVQSQHYHDSNKKKNPIFKWAVFKSIFLQRKHTTGHQIDAKIFKITNHQGNADHNEISPHRYKDVCYQKDKIKNAGKVVEKRKPLYNVGGNINWYSVQFSSVAPSCPTLCDPMNRSTPGFPVHYKLPKFTQTHVH